MWKIYDIAVIGWKVFRFRHCETFLSIEFSQRFRRVNMRADFFLFESYAAADGRNAYALWPPIS